MQKKHQQTLTMIYTLPVSGGIKWQDIESLFIALGAEFKEREGTRVAVRLHNEKFIFHRPHPRQTVDKAAIKAIRLWLSSLGIE
jgi:hypothetical protein